MRSVTRLIIVLLLAFLPTFLPVATPAALAASAYSPRHSGMDPHGGPKPTQGLPAARPSGGMTMGGQGYTDAYGNTIDDHQPAEAAPRQRPSPGAYGGYGTKQDNRPLPNPDDTPPPVWSFR